MKLLRRPPYTTSPIEIWINVIFNYIMGNDIVEISHFKNDLNLDDFEHPGIGGASIACPISLIGRLYWGKDDKEDCKF